MRSRKPVEVGTAYGKLTVLGRHGSRNGHKTYECRCECGKESVVKGIHLKNGHTKSCGCYVREHTIKKNTLPFGESSFRYLFSVYKRNAERRNLKFDISIEEFRILSQGDCYYCNIPPQMSVKRDTQSKLTNGSYFHNGVDRKDNSLGYSLQNCVSCCKICNRAKGTMSENDYFNWINLIKTKNNT